MLGVLLAERAVFGNGDPVGIVALILETVVIPVFALGALKGYLALTDAFFIVEKLRTKKLHPCKECI